MMGHTKYILSFFIRGFQDFLYVFRPAALAIIITHITFVEAQMADDSYGSIEAPEPPQESFLSSDAGQMCEVG